MSPSVEQTQDSPVFRNLINNKLTTTKKTRHAIDPSVNEPLYEVPVSTQEDVDNAVAAAKAAFPAWRDRTQDERAEYLVKFADAIDAEQQELAQLLGKEAGKPTQAAGIELFVTGLTLRGAAVLRLEEEIVEDSDERTIILRYTPLGVGVGIIPWNFPIVLGVVKLASALLTGNTYIWKPSPYTPYTALRIGEIASKIFPPGVVSVLSGDESLGPMLTGHPDVAKISFTGSVATGKKVMAACAPTLKRVTLELGGNDVAIICDDVDLAAVVPKIAMMALVHTGQVCMAIKRIYVHEKVYDAFLKALVDVVQTLKSGGSTDAEAVLGPVQNSMQYAKLLDLYSQIKKQGWIAALGGGEGLPPPPATNGTSNGTNGTNGTNGVTQGGKGFFLPATIIDNPPDDSRIVQEEQFGPIVPLLKWSDEEDVIKRANATLYGLGGSVWSNDVARAERMTRRLEAGTVWVNTHFEVGAQAPFGGHKESGLGVESGVGGLKGWCNHQTIWKKK